MIVRLSFIIVMLASQSATAFAFHPTVAARVHGSDMCWDPDVEFPIPCDDDDD
jgi:hypothetical protein